MQLRSLCFALMPHANRFRILCRHDLVLGHELQLAVVQLNRKLAALNQIANRAGHNRHNPAFHSLSIITIFKVL
jgi:hypothetical protein